MLLDEELGTDDELGVDDGTEELGTDDEDGADDGADEVVVPEQTTPLMVGCSSAPPFLFSWKPKLVDCPGWRVPFQFRLDAV